MSFGDRIKTLRRKASYTQEKLAELLSISPQAISRWETDVAMPDISLLPPIANLFGVTTDYLLGMDSYQKDLRKAEFDKAFFEYWKHDDKESNYQIAVKAVSEYPGNMDYIEWLASAEYYVAFSKDDKEYTNLLEKSVVHYNIVLDNAKENKLINRALGGIVLALCMLNRKDEAKQYAQRIENDTERNDALCWCLDGEEKIRHCQTVSEEHLSRFLFQLTYYPKTIEAYDAVEKILAILLPDGNYQFFHDTLRRNALGKAYLLCKKTQYSEAIEELKKAKFHAQKMIQYSKQNYFRFTAPLFDHVAGEALPTETQTTDLEDFYRSLDNNTCYDPIRNSQEFRALYNDD